MILVKAAPVLTSNLEEAVCVAGVTLDSQPRWIRLHPVPFRYLDTDSQFQKYQEVTVDVVESGLDRRPETWVPQVESIRPGHFWGTEHGWSQRRQRLEGLPRPTLCDLIRLNREGSGPNTPSLAVIRTKTRPELVITKRDAEQLARWRERAVIIAAQGSLFEDHAPKPATFEVVPWRFSYRYECIASGCTGHNQTIVDWEVAALWRNVRHSRNWRDLMRQMFVTKMWSKDRESELFVGNMHQRPQNFLVLGVFWPPRSPIQRSLMAQ